MTFVCLYFQVHQPIRLRKYGYFDIGSVHQYSDDDLNREVLSRVSDKCYIRANETILDVIRNTNGKFHVSYSISGVALEQFKKFRPDVLCSFKRLVDTGCVEILNETYYHSLSWLYSEKEFIEQIRLQGNLIYNEFGIRSDSFRNTELVYNNRIAQLVEELGYKTVLAEGTERILWYRSPNFVYAPCNCKQLKVLLRNYRLSDDIAFRFSNRDWNEYPLFADKYARWIHESSWNTDTINLFMDYETFGEHQWDTTGIFDFLISMPYEILKNPYFQFGTVSEVSSACKSIGTIDVHDCVSWADEERDITAWRENDMQKDALESVYSLEDKVRSIGKEEYIKKWRELQVSDHFYYMCTKYFSDGDVHAYFSPYHDPYQAYINYQNIISDFRSELDAVSEQSQ